MSIVAVMDVNKPSSGHPRMTKSKDQEEGGMCVSNSAKFEKGWPLKA